MIPKGLVKFMGACKSHIGNFVGHVPRLWEWGQDRELYIILYNILHFSFHPYFLQLDKNREQRKERHREENSL